MNENGHMFIEHRRKKSYSKSVVLLGNISMVKGHSQFKGNLQEESQAITFFPPPDFPEHYT
jgi:hypothetical protein